MRRERAPRPPRRSRVSLASLGLAALSACTTLPDDPDGAPGIATDLPLGSRLRDTLDCDRGDCVDWFRIELRERGTLRVHVRGLGPRSDVALDLLLGDDRARGMDRTVFVREGELRRELDPGFYFVRIETRAAGRASYSLEPSFERTAGARRSPRVAAPAPSRTQSGQIVEVESSAGEVRGVLFKVGPEVELRPGLRGRLLREGVVIAQVEVIETYAGGGARARLLEQPSVRIDGQTRIVIDLLGDDR